jgi:hypothetical protein
VPTDHVRGHGTHPPSLAPPPRRRLAAAQPGHRGIEANDEWLVGRSYISRQSMATLYETRSEKTLPLTTEEEVSEFIAA